MIFGSFQIPTTLFPNSGVNSECDHILGLIAALVRGVKLVSKYGYQSATRFSNSLHMHLGSSGVLTPLKMFCENMLTYVHKVIHLVVGTFEQG